MLLVYDSCKYAVALHPSMANMAQLQQVLWGIKITKAADPDTQTHCEHLTNMPEILY